MTVSELIDALKASDHPDDIVVVLTPLGTKPISDKVTRQIFQRYDESYTCTALRVTKWPGGEM